MVTNPRFLEYICNRATELSHEHKLAKHELIQQLHQQQSRFPDLFPSNWQSALTKLLREGAFFVEAGVSVALEQG